MELKIILTTFSVFLFFMFTTPCASHFLHSQSSNHPGEDHDRRVSLHMLLPRKLLFTEDSLSSIKKFNVGGKGYEEKELVQEKKQKHDLSDADEKEHNLGTRQEWIHRGQKTNYEFFTMDYSHVRRRRPIHNKYKPTLAP